MKTRNSLVLLLGLLILLFPLNIVQEIFDEGFPSTHESILETNTDDILSSNFELIKDSIEDAINDYNNLSDEDKNLYSDEYEKLLDLQDSVNVVGFKVDNENPLSLTPITVDIEDKAAVETALLEFIALNSEVQDDLQLEKELLDSLLLEILVLEEVDEFSTLQQPVIQLTMNTVQRTDREDIQNSISEYNLLSPDAQAKLLEEKTNLDSLLLRLAVLDEAFAFANDNETILGLDPLLADPRNKVTVLEAIADFEALSMEVQSELVVEKALLDYLLLEIEIAQITDLFVQNHGNVLSLTPITIAIINKDDVELALTDYELLSLVARTKLVAEKILLDSLIFEIEIIEEVEAYTLVNETALALTISTVEFTDKTSVESALSDFDLLSNQAKALLSPQKLILDELIFEILVIEEMELFKLTYDMILNLTPTAVSISDKTDIENAFDDFTLLSEEAQSELGPEKLLLDSLHFEIEILEEVELFTTYHADVLVLTPSIVTLADKTSVEIALSEYELLSSGAKEDASPEKLLLDGLLNEIEVLEEVELFNTTHKDAIELMPVIVEITDKTVVELALADYDSLTIDEQSALIAEKLLLDTLLNEIQILEEAETFKTDNDSVLGLTPVTVSTSDKLDVENALTDYNLLSNDAQAEVSPEKALLEALLSEIVILEEAESFVSNNLATLELTPITIQITDNAAVESALIEYELLSLDAQAELVAEKALLDELSIEVDLLMEIDSFTTDNAFVLGLSVSSVEITNRTSVETALNEYNLLGAEAQAELSTEKALLDDLLTKIVLLEEVDTFKSDNSTTLSLTVETVVTSDRVAVEEALTEYDLLSMDARNELLAEKELLDDLLEEIIIQEEAETFESNNNATLSLTTVTVQISNKVDVQAAIDEYNLLSIAAQNKLLPERSLLYDLLAEISVQEGVDDFETDHGLVLSLTTSTVQTIDKANVETALSDYNLLDPVAQAELTSEKSLLDDLLAKISVLEDKETFVSDNEVVLGLTITTVEISNKTAVETALTEYDLLSVEVKAELTTEKSLLDELLEEIIVLENVQTFTTDNNLVLALSPVTVNITDKLAIETAIAEHDLLSLEAQSKLMEEKALLDNLLDEITLLENVQEFSTNHAAVLALTPTTVSIQDKTAVEAALHEYDLLDITVQNKLTADKALLDGLLAEIIILEEVDVFVTNNASVLTLTPATVSTTDKTAVETAISEYELLSSDAQLELSPEKLALDGLLSEIQILTEIENFTTDQTIVLSLTPATIEINDKLSVEAALTEYGLLSLEAQLELLPEKLLLDDLLAEILILEEVELYVTAQTTILASTPATISIADRLAVETALTEYDLLSVEAKAMLLPEKNLLDDLLTEIEILEEVETYLSNHLSVLTLTPVTVQILDKTDVETAIAEYNLLTIDAQSDLAPEKLLLDDLLAEINILEEIETFETNNLEALALSPVTVEIADKLTVENALAEYDLLSIDAQGELSPEKLLLDDLLAEIIILEEAETFRTNHSFTLVLTPVTVEVTDKIAVETALLDYSLLGIETQNELTPEKLLLDSLLLEIQALEESSTFISNNSVVLDLTPATVDVTDKTAVEAALAEFDLLDENTMLLLAEEKALLEALLQRIHILEESEAYSVDNTSALVLSPSTVEITDKTIIELALADYNLLSTEAQVELITEKQLLDSLLAEINVLEEADTFDTDNLSVLALTPATVEITDKLAVENALAEYELLSIEAQEKLTAEKLLLDDLLTEIIILEEAETFVSSNSVTLTLTPATVNSDDKAAVENALAQYNLLSSDAKAELLPEKLLLDDLLSEIVILEEAEAFVTNNTNVLLLTPATVESVDKVAVEEALAEYNSLTTEAQEELSSEKLLLDGLLEEILIIEETEVFSTDNSAVLLLTPTTVETTDKTAVENAIAEYNLLSSEAKAELSPEKLLLDDLLIEIEILEEAKSYVTNNSPTLALTPATVEVTDKTAVETAIVEYGLLSIDVQNELSPQKLLLDSLLAEIEILEDAQTFISDNSIALGLTIAIVEISNKAAVETAIAEYNLLSTEAQVELTTEKTLLDSLLDRITILEEVDTFTTDNTIVLALTKETVETTDKTAVQTALTEYNLLSNEAKAELTVEKELLDELFVEITILEDVETFTSNNSFVLGLTTITVQITDKTAVQSSMDEYDLLSLEAQSKLLAERSLIYDLLAQIAVLEGVDDFESNHALVLGLTTANIETTDKADVESALADYDLLDPATQLELATEKALLDELFAEILILEDAETFTTNNSLALALTVVTVEITDKSVIQNALAEYDLLSIDVQSKVTSEKQLLDELLAEVIVLEDAQTFKTDNSIVLALSILTVDITDRTAVETALTEYNLLTVEAQVKVVAEKALLDNLLAEIEVLETVETFKTDNASTLTLTPVTVEITDRTAVETALAEYDLLSSEAKAKLAAEILLLDDILNEIIILEEVEVFESDNTLVLALTPVTVEITDKTAVLAALAEYDLLSADAQAELSAEKLLLDSLLAEINILEEAEIFLNANLATLSLTPATVEILDKVAVEAALAEYDLLTLDAQSELSAEKLLLDSLLEEIIILEDAQAFTTTHSTVLTLTSVTVEITDKVAVELALAEYELLTPDAQAELAPEKLLLDELLIEILILEETNTFTLNNASVLALTPVTVQISDRTAVETALAEYELLSASAQAEVSAEKLLLDSLLEEIIVLEEIASFRTNHSTVLGLTVLTVEVNDKIAVETALAAYELLSVDAQAELATEKSLLDSLLTEIIAYENSEYIDWENFYEPSLVTEEITLNGRTWFINNVAIDCNPTYDVCIDTKALALKRGSYFESKDAFVNGIDKITLHHGALRFDQGASFAFKVEYELQSNPGTWVTLQENGSDLIVNVLTGDPLTYVEIDVNITEAVNIKFVPIISNRYHYINLDNIRIFEHVPE